MFHAHRHWEGDTDSILRTDVRMEMDAFPGARGEETAGAVKGARNDLLLSRAR